MALALLIVAVSVSHSAPPIGGESTEHRKVRLAIEFFSRVLSYLPVLNVESRAYARLR